ncbi:MAG: sigma-70 family RNA polymerase sigma factor, partial [Ruminococcus sp.]|nr:sigma-70 family RNA polymerase sigma factor [Ruminococcus sp.]
EECFRNFTKENREKLIIHNRRLVTTVISKIIKDYMKDPDEWESVGNIGLVKAVDNYNPDMGTRFSVFAWQCIKNELLMNVRSETRHKYIRSIDEPWEDGGGKEQSSEPADSADPIKVVDDKMLIENIKKFAKENFSDLEYNVAELRFFNQLGLTQEEVGKRIGYSRTYVCRIEKRIQKKLIKEFGVYYFPE